MDPNSIKPNRSTFFSRVYPPPQSTDTTCHLSTARPQASTPSFFGKNNTPHTTRRTSEYNTSSAIGRDDDTSTLLPIVDAEEHSIYAGYKNNRYFPHGVKSEGSHVRHPYDNVDEVPHTPYPLKLERGTPRDFLSSLES